MIQKNIRFKSQKIEGKDWADNLGKRFSFLMLFPYRLCNSYKKIGHFVCSKRVGGRTENTPTSCNELFIRADRPQLNYAFSSYLTLYSRKYKRQKNKNNKSLGAKNK